jgi:hypothetical protein
MTRVRAILTAAVLFGGVCLVLGTLGAMAIESGRALGIYGIAVLGFASWVSWDTYKSCRERLGGAQGSKSSVP